MRAGPPGGVAPPRVRCQADRPGEASRGGIEEVSRMPDALAHVPVVAALAVDGRAGAEEGGVAPTAPGTATGSAPAPTTPAALSRAGAAQRDLATRTTGDDTRASAATFRAAGTSARRPCPSVVPCRPLRRTFRRSPGRPCRPPCRWRCPPARAGRSEEHTSELQSRENLVCRLL